MDTILIVDDDVAISKLLEETLTSEGFAVRKAYSGTEALMAVAAERPDLILVPALAFDRAGYRLGRGGGYYDRLLSGATGMKTGVGYDCQIFDAIPCEPHDIGVDYVVTETLGVECGWHTDQEG